MNIVQHDMETQPHEVFPGQKKMAVSNISRKHNFTLLTLTLSLVPLLQLSHSLRCRNCPVDV